MHSCIKWEQQFEYYVKFCIKWEQQFEYTVY